MKRDVSVIILFDRYGKILLQQRTDDDRYNPGNWALFGGGIDRGEQPESALKREAKEELGFDVQNPHLANKRVYSFGDQQGDLYVFVEECINKNQITLGEGQGMAWFLEEDIENIRMHNLDRESIRLAFRKIRELQK